MKLERQNDNGGSWVYRGSFDFRVHLANSIIKVFFLSVVLGKGGKIIPARRLK